MKHTLYPWDRGFTLRSWREEDSHAMADLHRRSIFASGEDHYTKEQQESWAHGLTANGYTECAKDGEVYIVAVDETDTPIAFCGYKNSEICGLYVDPAHQGRDIGRRLLFRAFINISQIKPDKITLSASAPAKTFYEKYGYKSVGERTYKTRGGIGINVYDMETDQIKYSDQLGPHNGRELSLMLAGQKRVAFFDELNPVEAFEPHISEGKICCHNFPEISQDLYDLIKIRESQLMSFDTAALYYLPGEEARMLELKAALLELTQRNTRERFFQLHRRVGKLLDYPDEAINYYIERRRQRLEEKHG
ncbi:GNAT family N-acetyltransferase [Maritalea mediterranea]|uniref:GNAT family N-acetyltransferase n=1 Tax=Maritalea mediterranea TaxID=2909667 RepID=A0ABS9E7A8_9HYPH|nr:GNAT family N-acetyltransferase [Maritalea mediterranea]MCF4098764.1 GNAT family N-acetyltransferase [Maritalea mediterranea]